MGREITQQLADKIRQKLCGSEKPRSSGPHDVYAIWHEGKVVGTISMRRSSKDVGHDYIPRDINVSMHFAKEVGICHKDLADYIDCLRAKGLIAEKATESLPTRRPEYPWERDWVKEQGLIAPVESIDEPSDESDD